MSNAAHLLEAPVREAAAAIANARGQRRGAPAIRNILDVLPEKLFVEVVEDARAALAASAALQAVVPPRPRGPLREVDASAFGLDLEAAALTILVRDRDGKASAAMWAVGAPVLMLGHEVAHAFWGAVGAIVRALPDDLKTVPPESAPVQPLEEPRP